MRIEQTMRLLQWGDSTLPVGAFSFSNGLETAVQTGLVKNAQDLEEFLADLLQQTAQIDGVALLVAHRHPDAMKAADEALLARKLNQETRQQTLRMGKKLAEVAAKVAGQPELLQHITSGHTPGCYPVIQAVLMARLGHSAQETFAVAQYGLASAVVSAALRLMRVDHFETQRILFACGARIEEQYQQLQHAELEDMASFSPMLDILAALHVQAHVRLFMN